MSNIFSFFGQEIKTGAPQSFEIPFGEVVLHMSTIALAKDTPKGSVTRVFVHTVDEEDDQKDNKFAICTLVGKEKESVTVDLNFSEDVALSLETTAGDDTVVHVTGYINLIGEEDEEGEFGGYSFVDADAEADESDEEEKSKLLRKMLEEEGDESDDEDFEPSAADLNESSDSTKIEELSDEDEIEGEGEEISDEVAEEVMKRVTKLEEKLGREANEDEIQKILEAVQNGEPEPKEPAKGAQKKGQQQQQKKTQQQPPKEENNKKRKQDQVANNNQKKNKKNKKK